MASWLRAALGDAQLRIIDIHMKFSVKRTKSATVTYDHRLKRPGHPVRSAIHKLHNHLDSSLNCANRHSVKFRPLAALKGEQCSRLSVCS